MRPPARPRPPAPRPARLPRDEPARGASGAGSAGSAARGTGTGAGGGSSSGGARRSTGATRSTTGTAPKGARTTKGATSKGAASGSGAQDVPTAPIPLARGREVARRPGKGSADRPATGSTPAAARAAAGGRPGVVSQGMTARLAERSAMRRHRIWRRVAVWCAVLVVLGGAVWVAFFSPVLGTDPQRVTISGEGTVIDLAEVEAVVAQADGVPLPRLDTLSLREQLLELTGVRDVQILRVWPNGLDVRLTSREPVAAIPVDGVWALLDQDGVRVATVDAVPGGLPEVDAPLDGDDARALHAALVLLNALPDALRADVREVAAATQDAVVMTLRDGTVVEWGSSDEAALKVEVLLALRELPQNADVRSFDVSAPTMPITR